MRPTLLFITTLLVVFSKESQAQSEVTGSYTIQPIWVEARVLGILENHDGLGVIQITRVDSANEFNLTVKSELLTEFVFGTESSDGDPKIPGVKSGDSIRAEIHGKFNPSSGQWDYRIFRYGQVRKPESGKE